MDAEPQVDEHEERASESARESEITPEAITLLVDALGMAWSTYQLYPEPAAQPAWERAMEELKQTEAVYPLYTEVGTGAFVADEEEVRGSREGVARLVKRLFVHEVAALQLAAPPRDDELLRLFEVLDTDDEEVRSLGGVRFALLNAGIEAIQVVQRSMLVESEDAANEARDTEVAKLLRDAADPEAFAAELIAEAEGSSERLTEVFADRYDRVYGLVGESDHGGREDVVRAFVEAYFYFPTEFQVPLLERFVGHRSKPSYQVFLDQFSGHDLARLATSLPQPVRAGLLEYARVSTEEGRPEELMALLQSAEEVQEARRAVAGRIGALLGGGQDAPSLTAESFENLTLEFPDPAEDDNIGIEVLRRLFAIEDRDVRFRRLVRVWTGKVSRSIRESDLERAEEWLRAVTEEPTYPPDKQNEVDDALAAMSSPELIEALVMQLDEQGEGSGLPLLEAWGPTVLDKLVELLADEETPARRRLLIDVMSGIAQVDPTPVYPYLKDERWFVVRNLATVLGRSGRSDVAARLKVLAASHKDHRVRVEALRSVVPLPSERGIEAAVAGLDDRHERVRQAAVALLVNSAAHQVDDNLATVLAGGEASLQLKLRVIEVLGERGTEPARHALREYAERRLAIFGQARAIRDAARRALGGGG